MRDGRIRFPGTEEIDPAIDLRARRTVFPATESSQTSCSAEIRTAGGLKTGLVWELLYGLMEG